MSNRLLRAPKFEYSPVNQCIYCGNSKDKLTDEHIIPFGLNGNFVLPKSSCAKCAEITSKVELRVLRGFLDVGRRAMGVSSRHKKRNKSPTAPVRFIIGQKRVDGEMPIEGGFHTMHLPIFTTPLALGGKAKDINPASIEVAGIDTLHIGNEIDCLNKNRATGIEVETKLDIWSFIRMLAKIAYSYYVAEKGGFPKEESPILPIALQQHNNAKQWIGCLEDHPLIKPESNALHLMDITEILGEDSSVCSVVRIKLFSVKSGPTYSVIVRIHGGKTA
ncbi:hypothetical protein RA178_08775 [Shewanella oncorhynchi]|uniref:HNH endonuclease 5 domain-containing protein n=1 Tax=Shewanella oncorhynchi TaxID=2726434 RepID=A0AA50Q816_9GAMM|nr:hypothetical protein [Shewanella oncorhynchi]WMB74678.1 hypothetical protein RA178_08775 [Shewanella oncorhynchi]